VPPTLIGTSGPARAAAPGRRGSARRPSAGAIVDALPRRGREGPCLALSDS